MNVKIFSDPKHIMASMVVDAYLKDDKNDADVNQKAKEKLAVKLYREDDQVKQILNHAAQLIAEVSYNDEC